MPGSDAVPAAGVAFGTGLSGMDQAVHFFQRQTASQGHGRAGGDGIFDASGGAEQCVGQHPKSSVECVAVSLPACDWAGNFGVLDGVERAKRLQRVPVVLSQAEVQRLLAAVPDKYRLFFKFLYGTGLRLMEALRLRVKDVDFERNQIIVHGGKGDKDRVTMLPETLKGGVVGAFASGCGCCIEQDLAEGLGAVALPGALKREISQCGTGLGLAVVLAGGKRFRVDPADGQRKRYHLARDEHPAGDADGGEIVQTDQTGDVPHVAPFVRDASFGKWL